ncbi:MAG: hypothetical protein C4575_10855 [Desulforudis sp.]|jgi:hypothetical protein|nr:MAG: hypothetical protein C4575_10855 [Desulforudis sp.]
MNIEWYIPSLGTPIVAVAEYGLNLNQAAYTELGEPTGIRLGFDRIGKKVIIKPLKGTEQDLERENGLPIRARVGNIRVNARDFVRFIRRYYPDLQPSSRATRYLALWDEENGYLVVDLQQVAETSRPKVGGSVD